MSGNTLVTQRSVRGRAGVIGIETRLRLFEPKSRRCGIDAALVPHHVGFRGLQIAHASQFAIDPVARPQSTRLVPCPLRCLAPASCFVTVPDKRTLSDIRLIASWREC
jgi:hypothetical protein